MISFQIYPRFRWWPLRIHGTRRVYWFGYWLIEFGAKR